MCHACCRYSEQDLQGEAAPHFKISRLSEVCRLLQSMHHPLSTRCG